MTGTTKRNINLKQAGFSLVELMVVVAIIGALAMVAVPRVNRFIAKARTSEAQVNLSSIYTFNKNFFVEFQGYTNSFGMMGYRPEGTLRYNIGWAGAATGPNQWTALRGAFVGNTNTLVDCPAAVAGAAAVCKTVPGSTNLPPVAVQGTGVDNALGTFQARANAVIAAGSACNAGDRGDEWSINQDKDLRLLCDGTQ